VVVFNIQIVKFPEEVGKFSFSPPEVQLIKNLVDALGAKELESEPANAIGEPEPIVRSISILCPADIVVLPALRTKKVIESNAVP